MPLLKIFWFFYFNLSSLGAFNNKHIKKFRGVNIKSLFKAVAVLTIFSVLTRFLGFIFKIFLSRTISTELLGVYSIVTSVFMVFVTILNSGLPLAVSKSTTINFEKDSKKSNGSVSSALIISLIMCALILIVILLGKPLLESYFEDNNAYILLLLMLPAIIFTGVYTPFKGYLWGREKFFHVSLVEFIEQIIRIITYFVCFYLFSFSNDLFPAGISVSVACVLSTIVGIIIFHSLKGRLQSPKTCFKPILKSSAPITLVRLATSLMQPFMVFLLPLRLVQVGFTNEQALSQLGIAMGMTMPLLSIPSTIIGSLAMAIIPNLTSLNNEHDTLKLKKQISLSITFTLCCSFIVIPFFIALGEPVCLFLFDNITAGTYLKDACWLIIPMGVSQITTSILNSLNLEVKTFKYYLYSCVILFLSILILPKYVGIYALLYGMGLSTLLIAVLNIIKINKTIGASKTYLGIILKLIIITIPTVFFTKWIYNLSVLFFPRIVSLILCGGISVIAFTVLMAVFSIIDVQYFKSIYKVKIKEFKNKNRKLKSKKT